RARGAELMVHLLKLPSSTTINFSPRPSPNDHCPHSLAMQGQGLVVDWSLVGRCRLSGHGVGR
ncbi:MAG: hypothetical protein ACPGWR_33640, partial [Ardenticatenaceae bacterium]